MENNLPSLFADLALRRETSRDHGHGGRGQFDASAASQHDPKRATKLAAEHWDYVVLQEQSVVPAVGVYAIDANEPCRARNMCKPFARWAAWPVLLLTWGRRRRTPRCWVSGLPEPCNRN